MVFADFPFLRYLVFFVLGILLYPHLAHFSKTNFDYLLSVFFLVYVVLLVIKSFKKQKQLKHPVFPVLAYLQLILLGVHVSFYSDFLQSKDHLIYHQEPIMGYLAVVSGQDELKPNSIANRVKVRKVYFKEDTKELKGEVIIYRKDSVKWLPGDMVWIEGSPQLIKGPTNPHEFDYRKFMARQQVTHQHFVGERFQKIAWVYESPIEYFFVQLRGRILEQIDRHFEDIQANQIAKALLLGQKKSLDRELSEAYATAGAMHVLAVSGLHVGIIYGFFFLWIKPYRISVRKRILYLTGIILLIWSYALLTGMSPSVMRAATMFSLMGLAQMKSRSPSIFNAIALSALIILVFDPQLIYAVGFQLSYLALSGILLIQPLLVKLWLPGNRILEYVWQISTVGIAAQIATFPISSFYFHMFPVYFLLSNLIAIPGAFLIMSFGVPYMLLGQVNFLGDWLSKITESIIQLVNFGVLAIQALPFSKLSGLYLSPADVVLYFLLLGFLLIFIYQPGKKLLWMMALLVFLGGSYRLIDRISDLKKEELLVYNLERGFAIDYLYQGKLFVYDQAEENELTYKVNPNRKRQSSAGFFPLIPFQAEEGVEFLLPNGYILIMREGQVSFEKEGLDTGGVEMDSGNWKEIFANDSLTNRDKALKIVFQ
ncbi:ComEC/Rec2 family competence protein [Cecembia calidifontis]|uniref:Competence protein ComEC n=1 Tax=Cecembia calidifontis TaxID=1187080 RepID=A0A4Q7PE86_9BACT|nr:ComEC/Rec2 family competence protein [Cecembia calidifontis]RZS98714.1 competence protein ComEC [Cecembia calidifontis]